MKPPVLRLIQKTEKDILVSAEFPGLPGCAFSLWMYESSPDFTLPDVASAQWQDRASFEFSKAEVRPGGVLHTEHKISGREGLTLKSVLTPLPNGIDIEVRPLVNNTSAKAGPLPVPNLCFQTQSAELFRGDRNAYQEFVGRCFLITGKGRTFLNETFRAKNTVYFSEDDHRINPPQAQLYAASTREVPAMSKMFGSGHSRERFEIPVIGVVSKDGTYLVAVATGNADLIWQAYFSCIHNNPRWEPTDGPVEARTLRTRIILMENDVEGLLRIVHEEFSLPALSS